MNNIAIDILQKKLERTNEEIENYKDEEHFYYVKDILVKNKSQLEKDIKILKRAE